MFADLIDDNLNIRLITRNVMSVYSTNSEYTDSFILKLKHSNYIINNKNKVKSNDLINYFKKNYNLYKNIFRFVKQSKDIDYNKFIEYLNFLDLNHLLWLHFSDLSADQLLIIETLFTLSTNKQIIILNYIDSLSCKNKLYTLIFHIGLSDKLVIIPFKNINDAVNNSTCQCYVKSPNKAKIQSRFSNVYLNSEFKNNIKYYTGNYPLTYHKISNYSLVPVNYNYSSYELLKIFIYFLKVLFLQFKSMLYRFPII